MLELSVDKASIRVVRKEVLTSGMVGLQCAFEFSDNWSDLNKLIVFEANGVSKVRQLGSENICIVPWEVMQAYDKILTVAIRGQNGNDIVIPTVYADLGTIEKGANVEADPSIPVTPELYDELINQFLALSNSASEAAERSSQSALAALNAKEQAETIIGKTPYVGENGHWYEWNIELDAYTDSGANATGANAPEVLYQYSSDNGLWHDAYTDDDIYDRVSCDNGVTWSAGRRIRGQNGTNGSDADVTADNVNAAFEAATDAQKNTARANIGAERKHGDYELIEEITLTENTVSIERTQEPDGTPYNFDAMIIRLHMGALNDGAIYCYIGADSQTENEIFFASIQSALSANLPSHSVISVRKERNNWSGYHVNHNYKRSNGVVFSSPRVLFASNIPAAKWMKINTLANSGMVMPAGSTIEIWAVRA